MAVSGSAARRYAEAMLSLAASPEEVDAFRGSLAKLAEGLAPDGLRVLGDPSIPVARRLAIVDAVAGSEAPAVHSLLALLVRRFRVALLPRIARAFGELVDRRAGIAIAKITTPVALDESQQRAFVERLERSSGKTIRATFAVDPALIGGAKVQVGDHLVDASVRAQLERLRAQLAS